MEELEQEVTHEPFRESQQHEAGHLDQGAGNPEPADEEPHPESGERLGERLDADEPAPGHVLKEAGDKAGQAAGFRAPPERQEHRHDQRQVGGDAAHAQCRHHAPLGETATEGHEQEQGTHASIRPG